MTVAELIAALAAFPGDYVIHLDFSVDEVRYVRALVGVREQAGWQAVALDGSNSDDCDLGLMEGDPE